MIHEGLMIEKQCIRTLDELTVRLFDRIQKEPGKGIAFFGYTYRTCRIVSEFERFLAGKFNPVCVIDNRKHGEDGPSKAVPVLSMQEAEHIRGGIDWIVILIDSASIYSVLKQIAQSDLADKPLFAIHRDSDPVTESEFNALCKSAQKVLSDRNVVWCTDERNWFACYQNLKQTATLEGDVAEFGVFQGGSAYFIATVLRHLGLEDKKTLYLFDTFEGIPTQSPMDFVKEKTFGGDHFIRVADLLSEFKNIKLVQGDVRETLSGSGIKQVSLAHVDCDQYLPTQSLCEALYPMTPAGGIQMFQNYSYGAAYGERVAVDLFFEDKPETVLFGYDGAAFVVKL